MPHPVDAVVTIM